MDLHSAIVMQMAVIDSLLSKSFIGISLPEFRNFPSAAVVIVAIIVKDMAIHVYGEFN